MNLRALAVIAAFVAVAFNSTSVSALPVNGVTIDSVSSSYPGFSPDSLVNGAGLNTSTDLWTHSAAPDVTIHWETMYYQSSAWIVFDLNAIYLVDAMNIWNFNYVNSNGDYTGRGFRDVAISTSDNSVDWISRGNLVFPNATGRDDYIGTVFSGLGWSDTRFVRFDASSIWGYGDVGGHFGLSEVRFYEVQTSEVPEPMAVAMVLAGFAALIARRSRAPIRRQENTTL